MESLTQEERKYLVIWTYETKTAKDIKKEFKEKFNKNAPSQAVVKQVVEVFETTGCVTGCLTMESLTQEERKYLVIWTYEKKAAKDIKKEFKEKFNKNAPTQAVVKKVIELFETTGCVTGCPNCEPADTFVRKPIYLKPNDDTDIQVQLMINSVESNPRQSPTYLGTRIYNRPPQLIKVMLHKYGYLWTGKEWINLANMGSEPGGRFEHLL